jgi:signal transduction histidine kinase
MIHWKNLSDTYKIVFFMLFLILFIQLGTLLYIWKFESKILLDKERKNLSYELEQQARNLENSFSVLEKELKFLSILELMDDIVVDDVDKRVAILLEKKAKDLSRGIILLARNSKRVVASSQKSYNLTEFLVMEVAVFASYKGAKEIGKLQLLYPFKNLQNLKMRNPHHRLWLATYVQDKDRLPSIKKNIIVSTKLNLLFTVDELFLSYEKKYAFESLKEIEKILFITFMISLFLLFFVVWVLSQRQVKILEQTQEILALKRTFLSTMSHELRTPLGSILNLTQHLMVSANIKENEIELLGRIENASEHLLGMINNLLQLSKLESNAMLIQKEKINISRVIEEMIELVEPLIDEKNLMLKTKFELENIEINTDLNLFKQVVMNLLSNAIKFTEKGSITIKLVVSNEKYILSVIDTGIGIEKEKQTELFSEFYQAHMGSADIKHSTGLGLALSQKVAKLINGKIEIHSEGKDKGVKATFSFSSL